MTAKKMRILERGLVFCVFAALLFSIVISGHQVNTRDRETIRTITDGWYRYEGDQRVPVTLPATITLPAGENLILCYDGFTLEDGSRTLCTKGAVYEMQIWMENSLLYAYNDAGFKRNVQMKSKLDCLAILPEDPTGEELRMVFQDQGTGIYHLNKVTLGRSGEILRQMWYDDMFMIISVFTMSLIGVVCLVAYLYLKYLHMGESRLGSAAAFLFICGAWCLLDAPITQQITSLSPTICVMTIYAFMTMTIPAVHFVRRTGEMEKYKSLNNLILLAYANVLGQFLLHVFLRVDYIDMLPATHLIQAATCLLCTHLLYQEYSRGKDPEIRAVLQAIFLLIVASVIELIIYWAVKESPYYGTLLKIGVLAFIFRLLCAILVSMANNIQFRAEAMVYKRLSREDRLTGLGNRRAFDEFISGLDQTAQSYSNVALFFLDVNGLKNINDRYGHRAGDELIVSAARCLSEAFGGSENCYRVGGDEFAAIVCNPTLSAEAWTEQIETTVALHNSTTRWHLSIAWGVSYLRDQSGNLKRPSDWMFEADQAMYRNKNNMKATLARLPEENES